MSVYGYCPVCGAPGKQRTRGIPSFDTCEKGHMYPSATSLSSPEHLRDPVKSGRLAIAVCGEIQSEDLRALLGVRDIAVIPYAASALSYCGPGDLRFRGLVMIPPRQGKPISKDAYNNWIEKSIAPYLAPLAPRITL